VEQLQQQLLRAKYSCKRLVDDKIQGQKVVRQLLQTVDVLQTSASTKQHALELRERDVADLSREGTQLRAQKLAQAKELVRVGAATIGLKQELLQTQEQLVQVQGENGELQQVAQQRGQQVGQLQEENSGLRVQVQQKDAARAKLEGIKIQLQLQIQEKEESHQQEVTVLKGETAQLQQQAQQQQQIVSALRGEKEALLQRAEAAQARLKQDAVLNKWGRLAQGEWGGGLSVLCSCRLHG
jgi:hypothetical protein